MLNDRICGGKDGVKFSRAKKCYKTSRVSNNMDFSKTNPVWKVDAGLSKSTRRRGVKTPQSGVKNSVEGEIFAKKPFMF